MYSLAINSYQCFLKENNTDLLTLIFDPIQLKCFQMCGFQMCT